MKKYIVLLSIFWATVSFASTVLYDDTPQEVTNKIISCSENTLTNCSGTGTVTSYQLIFSAATLNTANQRSIPHSLNTTHYGSVILYDNNNVPVSGYTLTPVDADTATLDMIGFGTISGNWTIEILSGD